MCSLYAALCQLGGASRFEFLVGSHLRVVQRFGFFTVSLSVQFFLEMPVAPQTCAWIALVSRVVQAWPRRCREADERNNSSSHTVSFTLSMLGVVTVGTSVESFLRAWLTGAWVPLRCNDA